MVVYGAHTLATGSKFALVSGLFLSAAPKGLRGKRQLMTYSITQADYSAPQGYRADLSKLFDLLAQGKLKPIIAGRLPLIEAAQAHRLLGTDAAVGKLVFVSSS